jgi:hypothetical protein
LQKNDHEDHSPCNAPHRTHPRVVAFGQGSRQPDAIADR